jgi:hypothetical protein
MRDLRNVGTHGYQNCQSSVQRLGPSHSSRTPSKSRALGPVAPFHIYKGYSECVLSESSPQGLASLNLGKRQCLRASPPDTPGRLCVANTLSEGASVPHKTQSVRGNATLWKTFNPTMVTMPLFCIRNGKASSGRCKSRYWSSLPLSILYCTLAVAGYEPSTTSKDLHRNRTLKGRTGQGFKAAVRSSRYFPACRVAVDLSWTHSKGKGFTF